MMLFVVAFPFFKMVSLPLPGYFGLALFCRGDVSACCAADADADSVSSNGKDSREVLLLLWLLLVAGETAGGCGCGRGLLAARIPAMENDMEDLPFLPRRDSFILGELL